MKTSRIHLSPHDKHSFVNKYTKKATDMIDYMQNMRVFVTTFRDAPDFPNPKIAG